jgi:RNA-directed DNA polymerase
VHRWYSQARSYHMPKDLYYRIRTFYALSKAWKQVYQNGIKSQSLETQNAVKEFRSNADSRLKKIQRQLQKNEFMFNPAKGVPVCRIGKRDRPLVVADIKDRVVQRSLLDVIQSQDSVARFVNTPTSFGGLENKKVEDAIKSVCRSNKSGLRYYITSDIKDFFTRIPRLKVINTILRLLPDNSLKDILSEASKTELENLIKLGPKAQLFPTYELGVAQGCCLSPLFGNVLLHDFDKKLNSKPDECRCFRYIDDFIIVAKSSEGATKAFVQARRILERFKMETYHPTDGSGKSKQGIISDGLEYLGCFINDSFVHPSKNKRNELKKKIQDLLTDRLQQLVSTNSDKWSNKNSVLKTLQDVSNILMGWGNQYSFCNSTDLFKTIDREIDGYLNAYAKSYGKLRGVLDQREDHDGKRKLLGVHLLSESKKNAIFPLDD